MERALVCPTTCVARRVRFQSPHSLDVAGIRFHNLLYQIDGSVGQDFRIRSVQIAKDIVVTSTTSASRTNGFEHKPHSFKCVVKSDWATPKCCSYLGRVKKWACTTGEIRHP
ncbi:hypothetical protein EVAR_734_1 [Eumeta japonica]|uniref:Uncharacterized protein n=1 Tax=Eumeta variegata TaxID=151549 RepID=A0A4C1SC19_EUMVA|nr:hypothetical protein EVAR_734_1 [Eumeta japonica]